MYSIQHWELRSASARPLFFERGCVLRVTAGRIWLTLEPASEDIWLLPAQEWCATGPVRVWLSAEPVATLQLLVPLAATSLGAAAAAPARPGVWRRWLGWAPQPAL